MKISAIYKIQSIVKPERIYIGSAININKRWREHLQCLKTNKHGNGRLQNHFNKYGETDLNFSILLGCEKDDLLKIEQYFIDSYNPYFNICKIVGSNLGVKFSKESRKRMSKAKIGNKYAIGNIPWSKNNSHSEESIKKMGQTFFKKGNSPWNKGKKGIYSERYKEKLRNAMKKRWENGDLRIIS